MRRVAVAAPPTQVSNAELVRWAFDMLNRGDLDALEQIWTEDTVERFPDRTCRGLEEIKAYFQDVIAGYGEGWGIEVIALAEEGDDVFVHWRITGTHTAALAGIEPTGRPVVLDGIDHFVVRDGKVASNFVVFDQMQAARQMGLMPEDGSASDKAMKGLFNARTRLARRLKR
jgi:ketosteroid isomerase-like protein